jgi:hypothetical protein
MLSILAVTPDSDEQDRRLRSAWIARLPAREVLLARGVLRESLPLTPGIGTNEMK